MTGPLILVVEDEPHLREILCFQLETAGFRVAAAHDGNDALRVAMQSRPDLVLTDLMMPGCDGLALIRRLRSSERFARTPIVALSAKCTTQDKVEALMSGANDYITKPWEREELTVRIRNLVEWEAARGLSRGERR